jgi:hypothetical protein
MDMELWGRVRHKVLVDGQAKRRVMREEGLAWATLKKILALSAPPGYWQKRERPKRKLGEHWDWMEQVPSTVTSGRLMAGLNCKRRETKPGF